MEEPTNIQILEKYTLEFIYDRCEHLIPDNYICTSNKLCSTFIYFLCATNNNIQLLKKCLVVNSTNRIYLTYGAAQSGDLELLKWARENDCLKKIQPRLYFFQPAPTVCSQRATLSAKQQVEKDEVYDFIFFLPHPLGKRGQGEWDSFTCNYAALNGKEKI